jgi:hypothetical protein
MGTTNSNQSNYMIIKARATVAWDPGSLVDGAGETKAITVTGAALGDMVLVSFSLDMQDITISGYVSAADTVECRIQNESTGTVNLGAGTLTAIVMDQNSGI